MEYKTLKIKDIPAWWFKRIWTAMELYDVDKDGIVSHEDMLTIADRLVALGNLKGDASDRVYTFFKMQSEEFFETKIGSTSVGLSIHEAVKRCWIWIGKVELIPRTEVFYGMKFDSIDLNGDGFISLDEFRVYWQAMALDSRFADLQFAYIDVDSDGKISKEEFVKAYIDYYYDLDSEHSLNRMYGPLISL